VTGIVMFDAIDVSQIPAGASAVAGYTAGMWPTASQLAAQFPHAHLLTIAISAGHDADCLDIETGDATPAGAAAWYMRQRARGITRPCLYASASVMAAGVVPGLRRAGIPRTAVRLWSAHYTHSAHICGPSSCGALLDAADGTQWTDRAMGRSLDQSLLAADFFGTPSAPAPAQPAPLTEEDDMPAGMITSAPGVRESHSWPAGSVKQVVLYSDWEGVQAVAPVVDLRIGHTGSPVFDAGTQTFKGNTAMYVIGSTADCDGCAFTRHDSGPATVAWRTS
jgi:hypothetical protein